MAKQRRVSESTEIRSFELVNWRKAQPRMKGEASWLKLYTSLLDHDGFAGLDDTSRVLIIALWLYAARSGGHILPADPAWLRRKIPILNSPPDLKPLLDARDCYGEPTPFVRYCDAPGTRRKSANKERKKESTKERNKEKIKERDREDREKKIDLESRGVPARKRVPRKKKKERVILRAERERDSRAEQTQKNKPADPLNPDDLGRQRLGPTQSGAPDVDRPARANLERSRLSYAAGLTVPQYDRHDLAFGLRIHQTLRLGSNPDQGEGLSEVASFAAVWHRIRAQLARAPPEIIDRLGARGIKEARRIGKSRTAKNRSSVWISLIRKIADAKERGT